MQSTQRKTVSKGLVFGAIALGGLFIGGIAAASGGKKKPTKPTPTPDDWAPPLVEDEPAPDPKPAPLPPPLPLPVPEVLKFDLETNWGGIPADLRVWLARFELAARIPGLARFLGVKAWQAFRANQPYLTTQAAAAVAAAQPELARNFFNAGDAQASKKGIAAGITLGWPVPVDKVGWASGSFGLFDLLGSSAVWAGIHTDPALPYVKLPSAAEAMKSYEVQGGAAAYIVRRILYSTKYKVLDPGPNAESGDSLQTWGNIASAYAAPDAYEAGTQSALDAKTRFLARAVEIGIDLAQVAYPWPPGVTYKAPAWTFNQVYDRLAAYAQRPVVNG